VKVSRYWPLFYIILFANCVAIIFYLYIWKNIYSEQVEKLY